MDPLLFVLGVPPENVTEKDQRYILHQLLMIARKSIIVTDKKTKTCLYNEAQDSKTANEDRIYSSKMDSSYVVSKDPSK